MSADRVLYLNFAQVESGAIGGIALPRDYVLACQFMHCGIIDRTGTLDQRFAYAVLDPIPEPATDCPAFPELCDTVGAEIVADALQAGRCVCVMWSGGIDSTAALIAIMKAASARGYSDRVRVLLSLDSIYEYPGFFLRFIDGRYRIQAVTHPVSDALDPAAITVTGEHGDQLFGSHLLESYVRRGLGGVDYRDILPLVLLERLRSIRGVRRVQRYLEPVVAAAPTPIVTLFDYMWWLNFALKWQEVTFRLSVTRGDQTRAVHDSLRHFYRDRRFQAWALAQGSDRLPPTWARYKDVAKRYILDYTGDRAYFHTKEKEVSLRNQTVDPVSGTGCRVVMHEDFRPVLDVVRAEPIGARWS